MYHAMACLTVPKLSNLGEHSLVAFGGCAVIGRNVLLTRGKAVSFF